jgi:hypothetical protein
MTRNLFHRSSPKGVGESKITTPEMEPSGEPQRTTTARSRRKRHGSTRKVDLDSRRLNQRVSTLTIDSTTARDLYWGIKDARDTNAMNTV